VNNFNHNHIVITLIITVIVIVAFAITDLWSRCALRGGFTVFIFSIDNTYVFSEDKIPILSIIGGVETQRHHWPWMVYVTDGNSACGASLIQDQVTK